MRHQSAPLVSCYSNRCQYQAACYVSCKRLSENHTGCITIAADNGKRKLDPRFRGASVSSHGTCLLFSLVKSTSTAALKFCSNLQNGHLCARQEEQCQRSGSL